MFLNLLNRLVNQKLLYWKQYFADGKCAIVAGFHHEINFVLSTGSTAMDLTNDATLGIGAGGMITQRFYVQAGISDANSDPTDPFEGFENVFQESDFFKWLEIGFSPGRDKLYFDYIHITFWHIDEWASGITDGWGLNASWQQWNDDKWLPFIRGGCTQDRGSLLEKSIGVAKRHRCNILKILPLPLIQMITACGHISFT